MTASQAKEREEKIIEIINERETSLGILMAVYEHTLSEKVRKAIYLSLNPKEMEAGDMIDTARIIDEKAFWKKVIATGKLKTHDLMEAGQKIGKDYGWERELSILDK